MKKTTLWISAASWLLGSCLTAQAERETGHNITIVMPGDLQLMEPCASALYSVGLVIKQNVAQALTSRDAKGHLQPKLATSWTRSNDKTWIFHLRSGVTFHDGSPFNAAAAAFSIRRTMNSQLSCPTRNKYFATLTLEPRVLDENTLEITTNTLQPILPTLLSQILMVSPTTPATEQTRHPIGTGPYVFSEWTRGERVVLKRFDHYWGKAPSVDTATYVARGDSTIRAAMIATGEADLTPSIAIQDATDPRTDRSYPNGETVRVRIGTDKAPLNDLRIRQALNYAIDRQAFVGTVLGDSVQPASQLVLPGTLGYNTTLHPWPYDIDKAKALVKQAQADGVNIEQPIRLIGRMGLFPNQQEVLEVLVQMWGAIGLRVKLQMMESGQALQLGTKPYSPNRPPTLVIDQHDNNTGDASFTIAYKYASSGQQSDIADSDLDRRIAQALEAEGAVRRQDFADIFATVTRDIVPDVVLFHMAGYARISPRLRFEPTIATNSELPLADIEFTSAP